VTKADWSREFDDPIPLPDGRTLATLRDAGEYVAGLPAKTAAQPHWQLAVRQLMDAATRGGIVMLANIAMRQALSHGEPPPAPEPRKKRGPKYKVIG
jgi:hypothetical protein